MGDMNIPARAYGSAAGWLALAELTDSRVNVVQLFNQYQAIAARVPRYASQYLSAICFALEEHIRREEHFFFDLVDEFPAFWIPFSDTLLIHTDLHEQIEKLRRLDIRNSTYATTVRELQQRVIRHFQEEEKVIFPRLEEELKSAEAHIPERSNPSSSRPSPHSDY